MRGPNAALPRELAQPSVDNSDHSPAAVGGKGADYNRNPVGTGPFVFKEWRAADRLIAERNPNYWDKDKPYLDRVIVRPLPDSDARYASLREGRRPGDLGGRPRREHPEGQEGQEPERARTGSAAARW